MGEYAPDLDAIRDLTEAISAEHICYWGEAAACIADDHAEERA